MSKCVCYCHRLFGLTIVGLGIVFLLSGMGILPADWFKLLWPSILLVVGIKFLFSGQCKCAKDTSDKCC